MSKPYFRYIPNFEYANRLKENKNISSYIEVKNLFKRGKLREDIFQNLTYFTKYKVVGDERPDEIAYSVYGSQYYDWVVLLSNNIINYENEWPMEQQSFINYLYKKYKTDANINAVHHYESKQVRDSTKRIIVPAGLHVPSDYSITYYDSGRDTEITVSGIASAVTNYEYELKIDNDKRNIYLLNANYLSIVLNDIDGELLYQRGSTQYLSPYLARAENIRLYS